MGMHLNKHNLIITILIKQNLFWVTSWIVRLQEEACEVLFDFMSIKNPQTHPQWTVWPAPLSIHQSAGLFFSFYFQSQAPTQRHSQSPTRPLPKQHGGPTNRSLSICLNIPPTPPPPPPPFPLGYDAIASKWKQESGRQVGPMLFRSISGLRTVDLRIPIWFENQAEASLVSASAVQRGSRL